MNKSLLKSLGAALLVTLGVSNATAADYAGEYTVTGMKTVYTNGIAGTPTEETFTMIMDNSDVHYYDFYEFAGYEIPEVNGGQGLYADGSGNELKIQCVNTSLSVGMVYELLGGESTDAYDDNAWITILFGEGGNGTISDFTVWQKDWSTDTYTLLASWTNLEFSFEADAPDIPVTPSDYSGVYTVSGTKIAYVNGEAQTGVNLTFDMVLDLSEYHYYDFYEFAGYEIPDVWGAQGLYADGSGNELKIQCVNSALSTGSIFDLLGGEATDAYDDNAWITILFGEDGTGTISNFTVWTKDWSANEMTLVCEWQNLSFKEATEAPEPGENYNGEYTATGVHTIYENNVAISTKTETFPMVINASEYHYYDFYEFAGYEIPDVWGAQGLYADGSGNELKIQCVNSALSTGSIFDLLGGSSTAAYDDDAWITITFGDNGNGTISDFTVWQKDWSTDTYTLLESWSDVSFAAGDDQGGVESIESSVIEGPAVFYNLQGQKVQNPSNGIFIMKQGSKSTKVLVK
ncbi:MAG: hypothetical protein J1F16_06075 [Muribaculaceae bacterium]|nr:hypothetical protein [Muribaculaceae bacterium]